LIGLSHLIFKFLIKYASQIPRRVRFYWAYWWNFYLFIWLYVCNEM